MNTLKTFFTDKGWLFVFLSFLLAVTALILGLSFGTTFINPIQLISTLFSGVEDTTYRIVMYVRLPRVLGALLAGSALAVSGVIIQSVLNNPLAGPNLIGINAGAGFFVLLAAVFMPSLPALIPFIAFAGALLAAFIVVLISQANNGSRLNIILTGFAITSIFGAGINMILILYPNVFIGASVFLVGGLSALTMSNIVYPAIYIFIALFFAIIFGKDLNIMSLGEDVAKSLGMNVKRSKIIMLSIAAVLAGAAVSFSGLIGFVGLVIPHAVRFMVGNDNKYVIPASIFTGAAFVTLCDLVSRAAFAPYEIPVGITMAFIGGPFFIFLMIKNKRRVYD